MNFEMEVKPEMNLEIGDEERFRNFIKNIKEEDRVALISHTDLDGISCPKIITEFVRPQKIKFVDYPELNSDLIEELREGKINKVIFTDLYITQEEFISELEKHFNVLIIDHHRSRDWNSERIVFIKGEDGYSACYLCYYLFSEIKNIEKWDWLVACTCISDYCHIKPKEWLSQAMKKYGDNLEYSDNYNIRKSGKFWDLQYTISLGLIYFESDHLEAYKCIRQGFGNIGDLAKYGQIVLDEIENTLKRFKKERERFSEGWYFEFNPQFGIKSIIANIISQGNPSEMFITVKPSGNLYKISIRRQDRKVDCDKFLKNLLKDLEGAQGGGHIPAVGGHFLKKDLSEVRRRLGLPERSIKTFK